MDNPKISIIIPCYNMANYLTETIDSVERIYNREIHEVIVVDDGSTDNRTKEILSTIKNHRLIRKKNGGLSSARNAGIAEAKGEYLLFLDADNLLTEGYLTKGATVLDNHKEWDIVYGESEKFGRESGFLFTKPFDLQTLMSYNYIDACCLVRKNLFEELGGFDEEMKIGFEDWEMWLRAAYHRKRFCYLKDVVVQKYRVRQDSMFRKIDKEKRDAIFDYLEKKYSGFLGLAGVSDFYYKKFREQTLGWTAKLFIRKYLPSLYKRLVSGGKISRYL